MPIPRVTCGADDVIGVAATSGGYAMNLTASATNGPITEYRWTILFVPTGGSSALNSGDFTSGVAVGQNVSFTAPDGVFGTYVAQCVATNLSDGPSNPYIDGEVGQQNLDVADSDGVRYPGDFQYNFGAVVRAMFALLKTLGVGGSASPTKYDSQVASVAGIETFTVTAMEVNADVPGAFDLRYCVVNGVPYKITTGGAPGIRECRVTAATTIEVGNLNISDDVEFLYGKA